MSRRPRAEDGTDDGFLTRWSRRKARANRSEPSDAAEEASERPLAAGQPAPESESPVRGETVEAEPVQTDEDMPDLETIDESTDMSGFFSPGVSEELRNQALRRLFRMAKFNITDGLDDYNEDFRNFAPLGDIVTSDMRHRIEMDRAKDEPDVLAQDEPPPASAAMDVDADTDNEGEDAPSDARPEASPGDIDDGGETEGDDDHDDEMRRT